MTPNVFILLARCTCIILLPMIALARPTLPGDGTVMTRDSNSKTTSQVLDLRHFQYQFFNIERNKRDVSELSVPDAGTLQSSISPVYIPPVTVPTTTGDFDTADGEEAPDETSNDIDSDNEQSTNQENENNSNTAGDNSDSLDPVEEAGDHSVSGTNQHSDQDGPVHGGNGSPQLEQGDHPFNNTDKDWPSEGASSDQFGNVGEQNGDVHEHGPGLDNWDHTGGENNHVSHSLFPATPPPTPSPTTPSPPPPPSTQPTATQPTTTTTTTTPTTTTTTTLSTLSTTTSNTIVSEAAIPSTIDSMAIDLEPHKSSSTTSSTTNALSSSTVNFPPLSPLALLTEQPSSSPASVALTMSSHFSSPIHQSDITNAAGRHDSLPNLPNNTSTAQTAMPEAGGSTTPEPPGTPRIFVELKFAMTPAAFCRRQMNIKQELISILAEEADQEQLTSDQIHLVNAGNNGCVQTTSSTDHQVSVQIYLVNKMNIYDRGLTVKCAQIIQNGGGPLEGTNILREKLIDVRLQHEHSPGNSAGGHGSSGSPDTNGDTGSGGNDEKKDKVNESATDKPHPLSDPGVLVAVIIACTGVFSCLAVVALQIAARRRNHLRGVLKRTLNRSVSDTSADSIQLAAVTKSRPNSGLFNPALDITDSPLEPSHQMNLSQLVNFCTDKSKVETEFEKLPNRMPRLSVVPTGEEDKNRFANVLPLALTRVKLLQDGPEPRSSYINANYVTGPDSQCQYYIATQAPTESTISDFWTMVWQQGTKAIVMLTQMEEDGQIKCTPYWPDFVGKSAAQKHGDFLIELKNKEVCQEYIASELQITHLRKIESRPMFHFWYTCWPTKSLPEPISLIKLVLDSRTKYEDAGVPVVVHCSPGTGRTGTFIALDQCMHQFETRRTVDVMKTVYYLRQERAGAVQSKEQYTLLYQAAREYASIIESPGPSATSSATTLQALLPSS